VVTGASGLLGRAVVRGFEAAGYDVRGTAFSRPGACLDRVDLRDGDATRRYLAAVGPRVVVHCAAERRPDVGEADPDGTRRLNVDVTARLAEQARTLGAWLIYLSTDYVFDGTNPPYRPDSPTHPVNLYGVTKRDGEIAALAAMPDAAILRVPILYGPIETLEESPVTMVAALMERAAGRPLAMDHWSVRYPTHTADVALVLRQLVERRLRDPGFRGIFHWSGDEPMTKYGMALAVAALLDLASDNVTPTTGPGPGAPRPRDCHLDCGALERLDMGRRTPFRLGLAAALAPFRRKT
jgi:S-adenosylmethionine synthetase